MRGCRAKRKSRALKSHCFKDLSVDLKFSKEICCCRNILSSFCRYPLGWPTWLSKSSSVRHRMSQFSEIYPQTLATAKLKVACVNATEAEQTKVRGRKQTNRTKDHSYSSTNTRLSASDVLNSLWCNSITCRYKVLREEKRSTNLHISVNLQSVPARWKPQLSPNLVIFHFAQEAGSYDSVLTLELMTAHQTSDIKIKTEYLMFWRTTDNGKCKHCDMLNVLSCFLVQTWIYHGITVLQTENVYSWQRDDFVFQMVLKQFNIAYAQSLRIFLFSAPRWIKLKRARSNTG